MNLEPIARILVTLAVAAVVDAEAAGAAAPEPRSGMRDLPTGVTLHYTEQGDADGEPVILLHGFTDSSFSWTLVLPHLPSRYRVFAVSQRGHGSSSRPESGYGMADFAGDVVAFMDAMELPCATIVGHSMGSIVAQQVAIDAPERVSKLVLVGAVTTARTVPGILELRAAIEQQPERVGAEFAREFQLGTVATPLPPAFLDRVVIESLAVPSRVWRAAMGGMLAIDTAASLAAVKAPALIIWGDRETIATRAQQDLLLERLAGARLLVYQGVGHAPTWEQPERVARDLVAFLTDGKR